MSDPEKLGEGIAPIKTGNGTYDHGWRPGIPDDHAVAVHEASDFARPGIKRADEPVDVGGVLLSAEQAERLKNLLHAKRVGVRRA